MAIKLRFVSWIPNLLRSSWSEFDQRYIYIEAEMRDNNIKNLVKTIFHAE